MTTNCASKKVRSCGCDHYDICRARQFDMIECAPRFDKRRMYGPAGQCFECDCANKLRRRACKHDVHFCARLREQASQPRRFVSGNAAGYSQQYSLIIEWAHEVGDRLA